MQFFRFHLQCQSNKMKIAKKEEGNLKAKNKAKP